MNALQPSNTEKNNTICSANIGIDCIKHTLPSEAIHLYPPIIIIYFRNTAQTSEHNTQQKNDTSCYGIYVMSRPDQTAFIEA